MGYRYVKDGKCNFCREYTQCFCDKCGLMICEGHQNVAKTKTGLTVHIYCPNCYKKLKK